jgi:Undecaprenyl-phosphate galactose phosphotransferase WbaP
VIFGGGSEAALVYLRLLANPSCGLRPVGVINDVRSNWSDCHVEPAWYLGPPSAMTRIAEKYGVFWGVVAVHPDSAAEMADVLDQHSAAIPHLVVIRGVEEDLRSWVGASDWAGLPGFRIDERLLLPAPRLVKRLMDIVLTLIGGLLLSPLLAIIALLVKVTSKGPIFYGQDRVGLGGRTFKTWKFRSMVVNADEVLESCLSRSSKLRAEWNQFHKLKDDPRITPIGRLLRKTSLDELPQLWNVLMGEMSLVGPRPITPGQVKEYENIHLYTRLRPGITGLWQVNGRNLTTFRRRTEFDTTYIRNWSPWHDISILARTLKVVLRCEGAY